MKITYYGHSCFKVETGGKTLLFDPFISPNPLAKSVDLTTLKPDYILLSHGHGDHVHDAVAIGKSSGATFISSFEMVSWVEEQGLKGHPMNLGGKWNFDFGTVKLVQAVHSSKLPDGQYGGPESGFVIWNDEDCFYFAGDTALTMDMQLIPMTCPPLQVAFLPIGDNFTMGYEDAAVAADFIQCETIVGMHYNTFGYIKMDEEEAISTFDSVDKKLILLTIGQTITI
ncbi:MAG: metal-dependent hydrolase [Saprospiraceae bacterium]|nr:metal-dependent hydrolase [Saprospiraceae bacterium]